MDWDIFEPPNCKTLGDNKYVFEVELLKNKISRKTVLKFLQLSASNVNKVVMITRWVHISLVRTEMEDRIEWRIATFERGGFPSIRNVKNRKNDIFNPTAEKIAVSPKLKL